MIDDNAEAKANIAEFLRQWSKVRGNHPELVYQVHSDPEAEPAALRISDLKAILKETMK